MNSIDQQQREQHHANLGGQEALSKMKELCDKKTCFFCTGIESGRPFVARPMSVQQVDEGGNLWFLSAEDSQKNGQIENNASVQLLFQGSAHAAFALVNGRAVVSRDKEKIAELWEPILKTWFTDGIDDPRITAIQVSPEEGYYWDTKHGKMVAFAKMVVGAASGRTMDDSVEGRLSF